MSDRPSEPFNRLEGVLRNERNQAIGRLAVRRGLISEAQFEESLRAGGSFQESLVARGLITVASLESLLAELGREEFAQASTLPGSGLPPEVQAAAAQPDRLVADFILVSSLGRGGAGEV